MTKQTEKPQVACISINTPSYNTEMIYKCVLIFSWPNIALLLSSYWPYIISILMLASMARLPWRAAEANYQMKYQMCKCNKNKHQAECHFMTTSISILQFQKQTQSKWTAPQLSAQLCSIWLWHFSHLSNVPHSVVSSPLENWGAFPVPITRQLRTQTACPSQVDMYAEWNVRWNKHLSGHYTWDHDAFRSHLNSTGPWVPNWSLSTW